jgi:hypothetical protein
VKFAAFIESSNHHERWTMLLVRKYHLWADIDIRAEIIITNLNQSFVHIIIKHLEDSRLSKYLLLRTGGAGA